MKNSKGLIIYLILGAIISCGLIFLVNYLALPAFTFKSPGLWVFIIFVLIVLTGYFGLAYDPKSEKAGNNNIALISAITGGSAVIVLGTMFILSFAGTAMFHTERYKEIAKVDSADFVSDFVDISKDSSNLAVVDMGTAIRVGDRTIGSLEHSSWYEVDDEYNLITYNGEQYRISTLNYGGFFKYNKAKKNGYIPGYVLVNSKTQEAKFVTVEGGIKYSPSAFFSYNLKRKLRNQYPKKMFFDSYFEIDDEGNPYWITPVRTNTIGMFGGKMVKTVIITNAQNGESNEYNVEDIPSWVDHAMPLEYLMDKVYDHYEYVNGYWNFSETGVYRTSYYFNSDDFSGYNPFVNKDGEVCFYTGLTPANEAESNVGFVLINTKTGNISEYKCSGAEESSAQNAVEGLVQNLGYVATFPTVVNVGGEETYLMCLKDKAGLIQRYALCNIKNYSVAVEADSIDGVINAYMKKLGNENVSVNAEKLSKQAVITNIYTANIEGTTYFYYTFENDEKLYKSSVKNNEKQVSLKIGNVVNIEYVDNTDMSVIEKIEF